MLIRRDLFTLFHPQEPAGHASLVTQVPVSRRNFALVAITSLRPCIQLCLKRKKKQKQARNHAIFCLPYTVCFILCC